MCINNVLSAMLWRRVQGMWERSDASVASGVGEDLQDIMDHLLKLRDMLTVRPRSRVLVCACVVELSFVACTSVQGHGYLAWRLALVNVS